MSSSSVSGSVAAGPSSSSHVTTFYHLPPPQSYSNEPLGVAGGGGGGEVEESTRVSSSASSNAVASHNNIPSQYGGGGEAAGRMPAYYPPSSVTHGGYTAVPTSSIPPPSFLAGRQHNIASPASGTSYMYHSMLNETGGGSGEGAVQSSSQYKQSSFSSHPQRAGSFSHSGVPLSMASSMMAQHNIILDESADMAGFKLGGEYGSGGMYGGGHGGGTIVAGDLQMYRASSRTHRDKNIVAGSRLRCALIAMLMMSVLCNYDHGAIPATLGDIQKDFPMGYIEQSLLGSLVYFGLIIGTLLAGLAFQQMGAKWLLVSSLSCLSGSLYLFSISRYMGLMYFTRFLSGLCQAMPVVYLPVWVDDFAPDGSVTRWMSYTQLASIGGTVCGYFLGGILSHWKGGNGGRGGPITNVDVFSSWRAPFFIQSMLLIPTLLLLAALPTDTLNISPTPAPPQPAQQQHREEHGDTNPLVDAPFEGEVAPPPPQAGVGAAGGREECLNVLKATCREVKNLLSNPLYVIITLAMSNLYFVVTGIQFWVTEYMIVVLHHAKLAVVSLSTFCFLTAPTSGVWFGGYICDLFGGYRGGQQRKACRVATVFAGLAAQFACLTTQLSNVILFTLVLWGCLFFGAALVPVAVGMVLSCVPPYQRSLSSAVSQFAYNMFGWFAAPLLSGTVMDIIALQPNIAPELPLRIGFSMILGVSCLGFLLFAIANFVAFSNEEVGQEELEMQLARGRLPTLSF